MQDSLERLAPGFADSIVGRHIQSPLDLEAANANLVGGATNGGTAGLHQQLFFRPTAGHRSARNPDPGLFLASASAHPGGGVHGACGWNAALAALGSRRTGRCDALRRRHTEPNGVGAPITSSREGLDASSRRSKRR